MQCAILYHSYTEIRAMQSHKQGKISSGARSHLAPSGHSHLDMDLPCALAPGQRHRMPGPESIRSRRTADRPLSPLDAAIEHAGWGAEPGERMHGRRVGPQGNDVSHSTGRKAPSCRDRSPRPSIAGQSKEHAQRGIGSGPSGTRGLVLLIAGKPAEHGSCRRWHADRYQPCECRTPRGVGRGT